MALVARWQGTDTHTRGHDVEIIVPLDGLDTVDPLDDPHVQSALTSAVKAAVPKGARHSSTDGITLDREQGRLRILIGAQKPHVAHTKALVNEALGAGTRAAEHAAEQRREAAERAAHAAAQREADLRALRDAFRDS
jgi:hypothetical protein